MRAEHDDQAVDVAESDQSVFCWAIMMLHFDPIAVLHSPAGSF